MAKIRCKLLRPLLNREVGSEVEYDKADATRLEGYGAIEIIGPADDSKPEDEKSEAGAPENKAKIAPANKADTGRKAKAQ